MYCKEFNLAFLRLPGVVYLEGHPQADGSCLVTANSKNGTILRKEGPYPPGDKRIERLGFKNLRHKYCVGTHYKERISKLSFLGKIISEQGLSNKAYKSIKRLMVVCFTADITNFYKLVRKIARECGFLTTNRKTRSTLGALNAKRGIPSLTGETKSHRKMGIRTKCWCFNPLSKEDDDDW